jgi:sulfite reductase (NADPH) flavoprotein alpha-component
MLGLVLILVAFWLVIHSLRSLWNGPSHSRAKKVKGGKPARRNRFEDFLLDDKVNVGRAVGANLGNGEAVTATDASAKLIQESFEHAVEGGFPVLILYGTEYGFSRQVARHVAAELSQRLGGRISPRVMNMLHHQVVDFQREKVLLIICSTTGDGVVPSDARELADRLEAQTVTLSKDARYAVLALGDRAYPHFCRAGRLFSEWLQSVLPREDAELTSRVEVDQEDWPVINGWLASVIQALDTQLAGAIAVPSETDYLRENIHRDGSLLAELANDSSRRYSKDTPYMARMVVKRLLTRIVEPDDKETYHIELDITGSGLNYTPGDALGIVPRNAPEVVRETLAALHMSGDELVDGSCSVRQWLEEKADLKHLRGTVLFGLLVESLTGTSAHSERELAEKLAQDSQAALAFFHGRELADVLLSFPSARIPVSKLPEIVRPLQPRFYSIASSPVVHSADRIALTVATVRYHSHGRDHKGVATCYLADLVHPNDLVPVFLSRNPHFRLVSDPRCPVIMVGPGTGVAPFRAFVAERRTCPGRTLLFFGSRHHDRDFLYADEFKALAKAGNLELYTAFSRDQAEKRYVQHRLLEKSTDLYQLVWEQGAYIYVCGDAARMARDVDQAFRKILAMEGSLDAAQVEAFMQQLERSQRYQRDVWVE